MALIPIAKSLPIPGPFWSFNREERNAVAVLFGLLARPGNLETFARLLDWSPADLDDAEICVDWTYLRDHSVDGATGAVRMWARRRCRVLRRRRFARAPLP